MNVENLFKAKAANLRETMTSYGSKAGFRIPEYQRSYSWNEEKVARLLEDMANGFYHLTDKNNGESFTFLGTLILVSGGTKEANFDGSSLEIVDGQQRLTTLMLVFCVLIEAIKEQRHILESLPEKQKEWLCEEVAFQLDGLQECVVGQLGSMGKQILFPRLVRSNDTRGREKKYAEYKSVIALFLHDFGYHHVEHNHDNNGSSIFEFSYKGNDSVEASRIEETRKFIKKQINHISFPPESTDELGYEVITSEQIGQRAINRLFEKLDVCYSKVSERNHVLSTIGQGTEADAIIRLILFSSYIMRCVVLTRVVTDDESSAFDIFDSLNTTGEPLTANRLQE